MIGELSNNGQPLRRFLQTFVLTPQSPNKYYVRNDIFRYHDEVFTDETDDQLTSTDVESKYDSDMDSFPPTEHTEANYPYHSNGTMAEVRAAVAAVFAPEPASIVDESLEQLHEEPESVRESSIEVNTSMADVIEDKEQLGVEEEEEEEEIEPVSDVVMIVNQLANEPKTYANMVSKSFQALSASSLNVSKPAPVTVTPVTPVAVINNDIAHTNVEHPAAAAQPPVVKTSGSGFPPQRERFPKKGGGLNRRNESRESNKIINDNDGNLLPNFSEDDLGNIFARYGKIVDIRINRQSHKTNSNKAGRNYGFITFESAEIVDRVIGQKVCSPFCYK